MINLQTPMKNPVLKYFSATDSSVGVNENIVGSIFSMLFCT